MSDEQGSHIAIIGMAGRFPGARNLAEYWANLVAGVEAVRFLTDEQLLAVGESPENLADPAYVKACSFLDDVELFDARFFGFSPRDAAITDPQHRIFFETAWQALEDAGYDHERIAGSVGVFATCGMNAYMMFHLVTNREVMATVGEWLVRHTGNDMNFLATRVSYELNLHGPSLNVQTACSSSLTALHLAVQSLLAFECDMALAGGSALTLPHDRGYLHKAGEILSPDGHCRPFDARSQGTVFGSGAGCVVLKRLADAIADGDQVLAVIKGSAINNDGSDKVGYLAPSVSGQAKVVAEALAVSGAHPDTISYIETHGTGTLIGDPIEVTALTEAYRAKTQKNQFCWLGSVKSNIGHLGEAAGMAGLIKTVLALQHAKLPPTINYSSPNPQIDFANSPFKVIDKLIPWTASPRRAGVTALGAGGTNAHVIVEEAPIRVPGDPSRAEQLMVVSGKTPSALDRACHNLAAHLRAHPEQALADVSFTLREGRRAFEHRRVVVGRSHAEIADALELGDKRVAGHVARKASVVFMFPGGGAQYVGMGRELYERESVYREAIDSSLRALSPELGSKIKALMFYDGADAAALAAPSLALPALFTTEYALAQLFMAWGLQPSAMIGHSAGEYVAACIAGVISHADALALVTLRGRLFEKLPPGGMLAVSLSEAEARPLLGPDLSFAAINGPHMVVASGPLEAIARLEQTLTAREIDCSRVHINVAAHSAMLAPILGEFESFCRGIRFSPPKIPIASNLTGEWIADTVDAAYWVKHLREPVRFAEGLARLDGQRVLIEIGPGRTLSGLAQKQTSSAALTSMRHPKEEASDVTYALHTLGRAWALGASLDWSAFQGDEVRLRVPLPTYPFERERYWIDRGEPGDRHAPVTLRKRTSLAEWFHTPTWQRSVLPMADVDATAGWLVFVDGAGLAKQLMPLLQGKRVVTVLLGAGFARRSDDEFVIDPVRRSDYDALFEALADSGIRHIVHCWAVTRELTPARKRLQVVDEAHARTYTSLLCIAQALGRREEAWDLAVVSNHVQRVAEEAVAPEKAALLGPCRVIPRELPTLATRSIDVVWPSGQDALAMLAAELRQPPVVGETQVLAHRGGQRFVRTETATPLPEATSKWVRPGGVYVITGGLGGIGLTLAEHLARAARVSLILVGRHGLPADRQAWLETHPVTDPTACRIRQVQALEGLGARVVIAAADVTDLGAMRAALKVARDEVGTINGVFHAAGSLQDELIELRRVGEPSAVLDSKIKGAFVLDALLGHTSLDCFVLFSSVSSILGLPGQVDYTAANASLDAFADATCDRQRVLSINWSAWQEIGMAAAPHASSWASRSTSHLGHPWLEQVDEQPGGVVFVTAFSRAKQWLLSEHVVRGADAVIPGTGYLELARAAFSAHRHANAVELREVFFLKPFVVGKNATRTLALRLSGDTFTAFSEDEATPHVTGRALPLAEVAPRVDLAALEARCTASVVRVDGHLEQAFVDFGPRWANLVTIRTGAGEALAELSLPDAFIDDTSVFGLHPALLDMATGCAQALIPGFDQGKDFYVPFSYERLRAYSDLPQRFFSHLRLRQSASDLAIFDVRLLSPEGAVLVDIEGFTMKRANAAWLAQPVPASRQATSLRELVLREGIAPAEGMQALDRMLSSRTSSQVVACSVDLQAWKKKVTELALPSVDDAGSGQLQFSRPTLSTAFAEPENAIERELAEMWKTLLGVAQVGRNDNFFDLGGESLIAVRLFNKVRAKFRIDFPLSTLFDAPTIAECAALISAELGPLADAAPPPSQPVHRARWSSLVKMQQKGEGTPFFCVAGMGGTTANLRYLASMVGDNRPFYGLEPPGLDGVEKRLYSVEALAEHYLHEVVKVQPHGPYFLGGYSGGGVAAFEMAKQLVARGETVGFLGFIDSFSPSLPRKSYGARAQIHLQRARQQGPRYVAETVGRRLWYQRFALMRRVNRVLGVVAPQRYRYDNIGDSWLTAESRYQAGQYSGTATLFRAREETALSLWTAFEVDEQHGWGRYVTGGVEVVMTPGDHTTMCEEPHVRTLAVAMRERLTGAEEKKR